ncbi:cytochrome P450 [Xylaria acuta]|nr:cytochrome P450 [Xylaria acuta]
MWLVTSSGEIMRSTRSTASQESFECQEFPFARERATSPPHLCLKLRWICSVSKVKLPSGDHAWLLTAHKDIRTALSSGKLSADPRTPGYPRIRGPSCEAARNNPKPTIVTFDDPEHSRLRTALDAEFTPEAVNGLRLLIHGVVDNALDAIDMRYVKQEQPFDLMDELAAPLAQDTSLGTDHPRDAAQDEEQVLIQYVGRFMAQLVYVILTASNAALLNSIGLGQWHKVRRNPLAFASGLAAECLRYNTTSAHDCRRAATDDLAVHGRTIKKGEGVICAVQSADRDEAVTQRPGVFDVNRKYPAGDLLGFGYGAHRYLGEHLAKVTLEITLGTLFARFPGLKLHGGIEDVEFTAPTENIGVVKLPVIVDPNVQLHRINMPG